MGAPLGKEMIEAADQLYEKMIAYDPTIDGSRPVSYTHLTLPTILLV